MNILFDMDGVITDFAGGILAQYNEDFRDDVTPDDIVDWGMHRFVRCGGMLYEYMFQEGFWLNLKPYPGALELLRKWGSLCHIGIATVPVPKSKSIEEKSQWIERYIPNGLLKGVFFTSRKDLLCADIMIDDKPENLQGFSGQKILFKRPWNTNRWHKFEVDAVVRDYRALDNYLSGWFIRRSH